MVLSPEFVSSTRFFVLNRSHVYVCEGVGSSELTRDKVIFEKELVVNSSKMYYRRPENSSLFIEEQSCWTNYFGHVTGSSGPMTVCKRFGKHQNEG